jgi:hypothetical protein
LTPGKTIIPDQDGLFEVTQLNNIIEESFVDVQDYDFITSSAGDPFCSYHVSKKIEAYCQDCKVTLCIDCILTQEHKNHEIVSI